MSSNYYMKEKAFIEASCISDILTWEKFFGTATFKALWGVSFQTEYKGLQCALVCMSLLCNSREEKTKLLLFKGRKSYSP